MKTVLISCCIARDLDIWSYSSAALRLKVRADKFITVVPRKDKYKFETQNNEKFKIVCDEEVLSERQYRHIASKFPNKDDFGWYLQQFIKLEMMRKYAIEGYNVIIWDADTIPLKSITFFKKNQLHLFKGNEHNQPYFDTIYKILGIMPEYSGSFVAQSIAADAEMITDFFDTISPDCPEIWIEKVLHHLNASDSRAFSEYETLGAFLMYKYKERVVIRKARWIRSGAILFGTPQKYKKWKFFLVLLGYWHITFEHWQYTNESFPKRVVSVLLRRINPLRY